MSLSLEKWRETVQRFASSRLARRVSKIMVITSIYYTYNTVLLLFFDRRNNNDGKAQNVAVSQGVKQAPLWVVDSTCSAFVQWLWAHTPYQIVREVSCYDGLVIIREGSHLASSRTAQIDSLPFLSSVDAQSTYYILYIHDIVAVLVEYAQCRLGREGPSRLGNSWD